jgi:hypothetical protein
MCINSSSKIRNKINKENNNDLFLFSKILLEHKKKY